MSLNRESIQAKRKRIAEFEKTFFSKPRSQEQEEKYRRQLDEIKERVEKKEIEADWVALDDGADLYDEILLDAVDQQEEFVDLREDVDKVVAPDACSNDQAIMKDEAIKKDEAIMQDKAINQAIMQNKRIEKFDGLLDTQQLELIDEQMENPELSIEQRQQLLHQADLVWWRILFRERRQNEQNQQHNQQSSLWSQAKVNFSELLNEDLALCLKVVLSMCFGAFLAFLVLCLELSKPFQI